MITEENRPKCVKCGNKAICYMDRIWVCGDCLHKHNLKLEEERRKAFIEG